MSGQNIIVVGASAGGLEAVCGLVADLPDDLPAAVLVVLHVGAHTGTALPRILARRTKLAVGHPRDGEAIENRVYVAVPDRHLLVGEGTVRVTTGPKENGYRPAVDLLFRSAAATYGPNVVGVVLSGTGVDGTAGLRSIRARGGRAIVQDPREALFPGMPQSAMGDPDWVLPVAEMAPLLSELARNGVSGPRDPARARPVHQGSDVDAALWTACRVLEKRVALCRRLAERAEGRHADMSAQHFRADAAEVARQAETLRAVLSSRGQGERLEGRR
jgi:two-component system chemotaxis response regulator CheB